MPEHIPGQAGGSSNGFMFNGWYSAYQVCTVISVTKKDSKSLILVGREMRIASAN